MSSSPTSMVIHIDDNVTHTNSNDGESNIRFNNLPESRKRDLPAGEHPSSSSSSSEPSRISPKRLDTGHGHSSNTTSSEQPSGYTGRKNFSRFEDESWIQIALNVRPSDVKSEEELWKMISERHSSTNGISRNPEALQGRYVRLCTLYPQNRSRDDGTRVHDLMCRLQLHISEINKEIRSQKKVSELWKDIQNRQSYAESHREKIQLEVESFLDNRGEKPSNSESQPPSESNKKGLAASQPGSSQSSNLLTPTSLHSDSGKSTPPISINTGIQQSKAPSGERSQGLGSRCYEVQGLLGSLIPAATIDSHSSSSTESPNITTETNYYSQLPDLQFTPWNPMGWRSVLLDSATQVETSKNPEKIPNPAGQSSSQSGDAHSLTQLNRKMDYVIKAMDIHYQEVIHVIHHGIFHAFQEHAKCNRKILELSKLVGDIRREQIQRSLEISKLKK